MISKEERAELRERLRGVGVVVGGEWNSAGGCESNWIHDRDGELCLVVDPDDERLATSVVNAAPALLDALDASDARIADLEAKVAASDRLFASETAKFVREYLGREDALKSRIAEIEADAVLPTADCQRGLCENCRYGLCPALPEGGV